MKRFASVLFLLLITAICAAPQNQKHTGRRHNGRAHPTTSSVVTQKVNWAELDKKLEQWKPVKISFESEKLTPKEIKLVNHLVNACHYLEDIFWRQSDPDGLQLYQSLSGSTNPKDQKLLRMLRIQGSRYDLLAENKPFVGTEPMSPGRGLYPAGLTREQIEQYVKAHPEKKAEIYSGFTVIRSRGNDLEAIPYHIAFRAFLEPAANELREAAALSDDPAFANFLRLRADAFLSDDYYQSDLAWLDLKEPKFDVIMAPYETYLDDVLGVKTSYGPAVLIRNEGESQKLAVFQKYVPDIQDTLPLNPEDRPSKRGHLTPMEVMDSPFRAGDLRHGYQAVADNLPNDPRIHQEKGTKKLFFKNYMDARVNDIILPLARQIMQPQQASLASGEGYLASTLMHEICHGLGPDFSRRNGQQVDIREAIGPLFGGLEEAKADVVGMYSLKWLVDQGALPKEKLPEYYASYVAGIFRTVRFSIAEAHGRAEMMEFNYLSEQKAITRDPASGKYSIDYDRMPAAIASLAKELLEIEATGDRARAEAWFNRYETMPSELKSALGAASNVPVDIDPIFSFPEPVQ